MSPGLLPSNDAIISLQASAAFYTSEMLHLSARETLSNVYKFCFVVNKVV